MCLRMRVVMIWPWSAEQPRNVVHRLSRFVEIIKCSLFSALNCIPQTVAQSVARERSSEIHEHITCGLRPVLSIEVSSANIEHSLGIDRGRSLIYTRKIIGPRTVLCGMPDLGACGNDRRPSTRTRCSLFVRKDVNHCIVESVKPREVNL